MVVKTIDGTIQTDKQSVFLQTKLTDIHKIVTLQTYSVSNALVSPRFKEKEANEVDCEHSCLEVCAKEWLVIGFKQVLKTNK